MLILNMIFFLIFHWESNTKNKDGRNEGKTDKIRLKINSI